MTIRRVDIWPVAKSKVYKLCFARWNVEKQPLEAWARTSGENLFVVLLVMTLSSQESRSPANSVRFT